MDIIAKAFNPKNGTARAVTVNIDGWISGLVTKGNQAEETIAAYQEGAAKLEKALWEEHEKLFKSLKTNSPTVMFYRCPTYNDDSLWGHCLFKKVKRERGSYPENPYTLNAEAMALSADFYQNQRELYSTRDLIADILIGYGKEAILLSSAPYERERDWEPLNKAMLEAFSALCCDHPEEHWDEVGEILRDTLGADNAYVFITDADECRRRLNWSVKEGEPTDAKLRIWWSKRGWALMDNEWNERTDETIQARTGTLVYEGFAGLCITEINEQEIILRRGEQQYVLTPGKTESFSYRDFYEDHEGIEQRDIRYYLSIEWRV